MAEKDLNKKKILILGGKPIGSCDIVRYAKEINLYTIVTDYLIKEESEAKLIADEIWDISTAETDKLHSLCIQNNVNAVFTGAHEFNIAKTLELASKCNLPFYATTIQLTTTSVKSIYKKLFRDFDIPVVPEYSLEEIDYIEFPVLVKPVDRSGGYGITICRNVSELKKAVVYAKTFSKNNEVLIEKYIDSKEVTIFYILQNGKIYLSAMADRLTYKFKDGIIPLPVQYDFPSKHIELFLKRQNLKTINALKSIGLKDGMLFIQAFVSKKEFLYYDIGYRLTGTQEYHILEKINGYNPLKMLVDYSLTGKMGKQDISEYVNPFFNGKYACNITFLAQPGKISRFEGIDKIDKYEGIIKTVINHNVGETIPDSALGTLNQVVFRVFGIANSKVKYQKMLEYVRSCFDVFSEDGKSMLIKTSFY